MQQNCGTSVRRTNLHIAGIQKAGFDLLDRSKGCVCRRVDHRGARLPDYSCKRDHAELRSSNSHGCSANKLTTVVFGLFHHVLHRSYAASKTWARALRRRASEIRRETSASNSSRLAGFVRYPWAPAAIASRLSCSYAAPEKKRMGVSGFSSRNLAHRSIPDTPGIQLSMTNKSNDCDCADSMPCSAFSASCT